MQMSLLTGSVNHWTTCQCPSLAALQRVGHFLAELLGRYEFHHASRIVHLDVNPHNVMFQSKRNWIVKLVDFGSAQVCSIYVCIRSSSLKGKLFQFTKESVKPAELDIAWAAPELHIKETPVTVQSDVWGMGVIAFCL